MTDTVSVATCRWQFIVSSDAFLLPFSSFAAVPIFMASLFVVRGRDQGKHFQVGEGVLRIGRESGNDIQLLDSESSRNHAELRCSNGQVELRDLGSSNGTRVNGGQIERKSLSSGIESKSVRP